MSVISFAKAVLGFVVGAGAGASVAWLGIRVYCNYHPAPAQQIGDIGIIVVYGLVAVAVVVLLGVLGGIGGVVLVRRFL